MRNVINLALSFVSADIAIPVIGNYALDMSFVKDILVTETFTDMFMRAEVFNQAKGTRAKVSKPAELTNRGGENPDLEIMLNKHLFETFFSSMQESGELSFTLTDGMVFNMTKFLHLRTSNFKYYIPGLGKYGDVPMTVVITKNNALPRMIIGDKTGDIRFVGDASADFRVEGQGSKIILGMGMDISLHASIENKNLSAKINNIELTGLEIKEIKDIDKPDVKEMFKEFNILFKILANAANILALEKPIIIPDQIDLSIAKLEIKKVYLKILEGVIDIAVNLKLK